MKKTVLSIALLIAATITLLPISFAYNTFYVNGYNPDGSYGTAYVQSQNWNSHGSTRFSGSNGDYRFPAKPWVNGYNNANWYDAHQYTNGNGYSGNYGYY